MRLAVVAVVLILLPIISLIFPRWLRFLPVSIFGLVLPIFILELLLRGGFRYEDITWTPPDAFQMDYDLDALHNKASEGHPYGFNDTVRDPAKAPGTLRIAVLGDSVIWGDGINEEDRWSRKLEKKLRAWNPNIQVLHWGLRAWSTKSQINFLQKNAAAWQLDYLLIAFFPNDPDLGNFQQQYMNWRGHKVTYYFSEVFPYTAAFLFGYVNQFWNEQVPGWGYEYWERQLYTPQNLEAYGQTLKELRLTLDTLKVPTTVMLTASNYIEYFRERLDYVMPLFDAAQIPYINLYPAIVRDLSSVPLYQLRANRADGHPGVLVTEVLAQETFEFLKKELPKKGLVSPTLMPPAPETLIQKIPGATP